MSDTKRTDPGETLTEDRTALLERAQTIGLSAKKTITRRTFAADQAATIVAGARDGGKEALPKISVDERVDLEGSPPNIPTRRDYAIVKTIGEGGMGRVHLARQRSLDRDVALKTLKPGASSEVAEALFREAR